MSRNSDEFETKSSEIVRIGDFTFFLETKELQSAGGQTVELRSQSADVLVALARNAGAVVSKDKLIETVWVDTFVTDDSLVQCIADIRRALGDADHKLVQTFPKKGYKLIAERIAAPGGADPTSAAATGAPTALAPPAPAPTRRALILAAAAVLVAALAYFWLDPLAPARPEGDGTPRIAVLPFDDFSTGDDKGYFSDAIAEGIITELARSRMYEVIARNSSFRYRDQSTDIRTIAKDLGVHYVLEGSQQKNGDKLRVTAQLIDARNGSHIWAHTYEQQIGDLFSVQDKIIRTLADRVGYRITRPVPGADPGKVTALHHYLAGVVEVRKLFDEEHSDLARDHFQKAIEADPKSHFGYLGMAFNYRSAAVFGWHGYDRDEAFRLGFENANKALKIAPDDPDVHYALARLYTEVGEDDLSLAQFDKAIQLNPSDSSYLVASTTLLLNIGRTDEAIERLKLAMGIDPFHPDWYHWQMGWALWEKDDCEGALASFQKMAQIPKGAQRMLAGVFACLGDVENAQKAYKVFYTDAREPTIAEQRAEWIDTWTAPGSLERFLDHMRIAGMKD